MGVTSLNSARSKDGGDFGSPEFLESFWLHDETDMQAASRRSVRKKFWKDVVFMGDGESLCSINAVTLFHRVMPAPELSRTHRRPCDEVQKQQVSSSRRTMKRRRLSAPLKS